MALTLMLSGCSFLTVERLSGETANPMSDIQLDRCTIRCGGELCPLASDQEVVEPMLEAVCGE